MKNEAARARAMRLEAANRLIGHQKPVSEKSPVKKHSKVRRMAQPAELHIEMAKVAGT